MADDDTLPDNPAMPAAPTAAATGADRFRLRTFSADANDVLMAIFADSYASDDPRDVAAALRILYDGRIAWIQEAIFSAIRFAAFASQAAFDRDDDDDDDDRDHFDYDGYCVWLRAVRGELMP
jgi:hypothetical protein